MLISNENTETLFAPFRLAIGEGLYAKICNDARALYGRVDKDIKNDGGDWRVKGKVAKGEIANKAVYTLLLPPNNPITPLTLAAMDVRDCSRRHSFAASEVACPLPEACVSWIAHEKTQLASKPGGANKEPVNVTA